MKTVLLLVLILLATEQGLLLPHAHPRQGGHMPTLGDFHQIANSFPTKKNLSEQLGDVRPVFKGSLHGSCLEAVINSICHGLRLYKAHITETNGFEPDGFKCENSDCHVSNLRSRYCSGPLPMTERGREGQLSGNNNVGPCIRFMNDTVYSTVRRHAGWICERKFRCICGDCLPLPKYKYHEDRTERLSPSMKMILSHLLRNHVSKTRKEEVLENLLLGAFNELIPREGPAAEVKSVRVNSPDRNYPASS